MPSEAEFQLWMENVNAYLEQLVGCCAEDLPDYCYRQAYEDGIEPVEAAADSLEAAGYC